MFWRRWKQQKAERPALRSGGRLEPDLLDAVSPVRAHLRLQHYGRWALYATAAAAGVAFATYLGASLPGLVGSAPLPAAVADRYAAMAAMAAGALVLALGITRRPGLPEVARRLDGAGLAERLTTCLEFAGQENRLLAQLRADTVSTLRAVDWRRRLPWRAPKGALYANAVLAMLLAALHIFPNPLAARMQRAQAQKEAITAQAERLESSIRAMEAKAEKAPAASEAARILEQLRDELKKARTASEAMQALGNAEDQLDMLDNAGDAQDALNLAETGKTLEQAPPAQPLADALNRQDFAEAANQLEQLAQNAANLTPEQRQQLAQAMQQAAQQMQQAEQRQGRPQSTIAREMARAAQAMQAGQMQQASASLNQAAQALAEAAQAADARQGELAEALAAARAAMEGAREEIAAVMAGEGNGKQDGKNGIIMPGQGEGQNGIVMPGQGQGQGEGQAMLPGQGQGQPLGQQTVATGVASSGAGRQSFTPASGSPDDPVGQPGQSGTEAPPSARSDYSQVYDPTPRLDGDGKSTFLQGEAKGAGGSVQFESPEAKVAAGQFRPYHEVFAKYEEQAIQGMQRVELPPGVQQMVKSYFSTLDPANQESNKR